MAKVWSRHPEWLVLLCAAVGWVVLWVLLWRGSATAMPAHGQHTMHPGSMSEPAGIDQAASVALVWLAMTVAMMLPTTVPMVRYVAFSTRRTRRQRSILLFAAGYVAVWMLLGLPVAVLESVVPPLVDSGRRGVRGPGRALGGHPDQAQGAAQVPSDGSGAVRRGGG